MYDAALKLVGSQPEPISVEEYARRVNRLTAQLRPGDLLVISFFPKRRSLKRCSLSIPNSKRYALFGWMG